MPRWYQSTTQRGDQTGSRYVYPTINLDPAVLPPETKRGVWASRVQWGKRTYLGALYFGPRVVKDEEHDVLEIYLLDFSSTETQEIVQFTLEKYLRAVMNFPTLAALREQVARDIVEVRKALDEG